MKFDWQDVIDNIQVYLDKAYSTDSEVDKALYLRSKYGRDIEKKAA